MLLLSLGFIALPVLAAACPDQDLSAEKDPLYELLLIAKSEPEGIALGKAIWDLYSTAPDAKAQDLLDRGVRYLQRGQFITSRKLLTELIEYCPDYAEGWNQRAFARYLDGDLDGALQDLTRTLEIEPRHFGALSGRGLTLLRQGRSILGHQALRDALKVNPWLNERHLLPPEEKT
jgi:tetratricopeptide (TPR) repeat protein